MLQSSAATPGLDSQTTGGLALPCEFDVLREILRFLEEDEEKSHELRFDEFLNMIFVVSLESSSHRRVVGRFWKLAAPYWLSDDKVQALWRLMVVFALTLGTTGIRVGFNFLGRDFYNALANKDLEQFTKQLMYYLASFAGGIPAGIALGELQ